MSTSNTKYRNWTIRQIVHHLADSHLNSYVRFKLALTEECPTIKPYDESRWSLLADAQRADVEPSLQLVQSMHDRWTNLLRSLTPDAFLQSFFHPESRETVPLWRALAYLRLARSSPHGADQVGEEAQVTEGQVVRDRKTGWAKSAWR